MILLTDAGRRQADITQIQCAGQRRVHGDMAVGNPQQLAVGILDARRYRI